MTEYLWAVQDDHCLWGFINSKGIVIPPQFEGVSNFTEGLAGVTVGDKHGFINRLGEIVIPPCFDYASNFSEGLASVRIGHQWGAIDTTGSLVIPVEFDLIDVFSEGLAIAYTGGTVKKSKYYGQTDRLVIDGGMWGVVDKTGDFVIPPRFKLYGERDVEDMSPPGEGFKNGILKFYGSALITEESEVEPAATEIETSDTVSSGVSITTEPVWDEDSNEWREALFVSVEAPTLPQEIEKYGFIDRAGNIIIEPVWDEVSDEWEGDLLRIRNQSEEEDGIDEQVYLKPGGEIAFTNNSVNLRPFHEGMAAARNEDGLTGYVDTCGQLIIDCQFHYAGDFSEGMADATYSPDEEMPLYGYIDKLGQMVISEQFTRADGFRSNGLAVVEVPDGKCGLIDKMGQFVLPPRYDWLFAMINSDDEDILYEFCAGEENNNHGVIDSEGNVIIKPIYMGIWFDSGIIQAELEGVRDHEPKIYFNKAGEIIFRSTPAEP
jgi:WG containing repeat